MDMAGGLFLDKIFHSIGIVEIIIFINEAGINAFHGINKLHAPL